MRQHFKTIEETLELFGNEAFYTISVDNFGISFQGKFHSQIVRECLDEGYTFGNSSNGYVILTKNQIRIILTD